MLFDVAFILTNSTDGVVVLLTMYELLNPVFTFCVVMLTLEDTDTDIFVKLLIYSVELLSNIIVLFDVVFLLIVSVSNLSTVTFTVFVAEIVVFINVIPLFVTNIFGVVILSVSLVITLTLLVLSSNRLLPLTLNVCNVVTLRSVVLKLFITKLFVVPVVMLTNSVTSSFTLSDLVLNNVLPLTTKPVVLFTVIVTFVVLFVLDIVNTSV
jgi:hypothetical protein